VIDTPAADHASDKLLVVINHFDQRPLDDLLHLLDALHSHDDDITFDTCVVINQSLAGRKVRELPNVDFLHYRENTGMNIGAWDYGWRCHPDYDYYLFLQDECIVSAHDWARQFITRLQDRSVGLVGETFNAKWNRPWSVLQNKKVASTMPGHFIDGKPADRVAAYLDFMARHNIDPTPGAGHVRALIWALRGDTLRAIDGFPLGDNYGECIAAEIAVSKMVEALGLKVVQLSAEPFYCFSHAEWGKYAKKTAEAARLSGWKVAVRRLLKVFR
jgi:hypothetical protein